MSRHNGFRALRRLITASVLVAVGLALTPIAAHAAGWRTATAQGFGLTQGTGSANAEANARSALTSQAAQFGEVCTSVTSSSTLIYVVPSGGGYQFSGTATGYCAPPPPPPVYDTPRSATSQAGASNGGVAQQAAYQAAQSAILAVGHNCTNWTAQYTLVYAAPGGVWSIYNATVNAICVD
jgi:hypothetical protein